MQSLPSSGALTQPRSAADARWFGVGHSCSEDPYLRGREAALMATASAFDEPALVIVLADVDSRLPKLLDGVRRALRGNPAIVGCTTNGELTPVGPIGGGVAVVALGGPGFQVRTAVGQGIGQDRREAGRTVAACMDGLDRPHQILILLSDGLSTQHDLVRGVYGVTGAGVPLVGGCAGDDMAFQQTFQFVGDVNGIEILTDSVIGVGLGSAGPIGVGIAHGWRKSGDPMTITRSTGGRIYELDGERALDVFLERCDEPPPDLEDRAEKRLGTR